jgi:hypothetical protein
MTGKVREIIALFLPSYLQVLWNWGTTNIMELRHRKYCGTEAPQVLWSCGTTNIMELGHHKYLLNWDATNIVRRRITSIMELRQNRIVIFQLFISNIGKDFPFCRQIDSIFGSKSAEAWTDQTSRYSVDVNTVRSCNPPSYRSSCCGHISLYCVSAITSLPTWINYVQVRSLLCFHLASGMRCVSQITCI